MAIVFARACRAAAMLAGTLWLAVATAAAGAAPPTFSRSDFDFNQLGTASVVVADLDRDGRDDLLMSIYKGGWQQPDVDYQSWTQIRFQDAGGYTRADIPGGNGVSLAVGDVDGDGWPDIVSSFADGIGIMYGRGARSFAPMLRLTGPPVVVRVADVDGDGRSDVVTADRLGSSMRWAWLQRSDGTLNPPVSLPPESFPTAAVAADFNGDGIVDVARLNAAWELTVATANGTGFDGESFIGRFTNLLPGILLDTYAHVLAVGDLDSDGRQDLVVPGFIMSGPGTSFGGYLVHVLFNTTLAPPAVSLTASPRPSSYGEVVTLTAMVTGAQFPEGTVAFREGARVVPGCATPATIVAGVAICATAALPAGTHTITAAYSGDAHNAAATSAPVAHVVDAAPVSVALSASPRRPLAGQPLILTATLAGGFEPGGTVAFAAGGAPIAGCEAIAVVSARARCAIRAWSAGEHAIAATYGGDPNHLGGVSPLLVHTVTGADAADIPTLHGIALVALAGMIGAIAWRESRRRAARR